MRITFVHLRIKKEKEQWGQCSRDQYLIKRKVDRFLLKNRLVKRFQQEQQGKKTAYEEHYQSQTFISYPSKFSRIKDLHKVTLHKQVPGIISIHRHLWIFV